MWLLVVWFWYFFFQAEDGIRDHCVTGVQTCALPIYSNCKDWTPRCWQGFFSRAGSSISGLACNWLATSDGSIATTIGTGDLILMLTCAPSWSGVNPP